MNTITTDPTKKKKLLAELGKETESLGQISVTEIAQRISDIELIKYALGYEEVLDEQRKQKAIYDENVAFQKEGGICEITIRTKAPHSDQYTRRVVEISAKNKSGIPTNFPNMLSNFHSVDSAAVTKKLRAYRGKENPDFDRADLLHIKYRNGEHLVAMERREARKQQ